MNGEEFSKRHLETLIEDKDVRQYFEGARDDREREELRRDLDYFLKKSGEENVLPYFDNKSILSKIGDAAKGAGVVTDLAGDYLFWAFGGAGLGLKAIGFGLKSLADLIYNRHYEKYSPNEGHITKDGMLILSEGLLERAAGYLPIGVGSVADFWRLERKYDSRIEAFGVYRAKQEFMKKRGAYKPSDKPNIVSLDAFKNKQYESIDETVDDGDELAKLRKKREEERRRQDELRKRRVA